MNEIVSVPRIEFMPENFVKLITVCLYWESDNLDDRFRRTVGKILPILSGLEICTDEQIEMIQRHPDGVLYRQALFDSALITYGNSFDRKENALITVHLERKKSIPHLHIGLVTNTSLALTLIGESKARQYESEFAKVIDRKKYRTAKNEAITHTLQERRGNDAMERL